MFRAITGSQHEPNRSVAYPAHEDKREPSFSKLPAPGPTFRRSGTVLIGHGSFISFSECLITPTA